MRRHSSKCMPFNGKGWGYFRPSPLLAALGGLFTDGPAPQPQVDGPRRAIHGSWKTSCGLPEAGHPRSWKISSGLPEAGHPRSWKSQVDCPRRAIHGSWKTSSGLPEAGHLRSWKSQVDCPRRAIQGLGKPQVDCPRRAIHGHGKPLVDCPRRAIHGLGNPRWMARGGPSTVLEISGGLPEAGHPGSWKTSGGLPEAGHPRVGETSDRRPCSLRSGGFSLTGPLKQAWRARQ
jgi:hypothetical protein